MDGATFLARVRIKNYKSIAACDVVLRPLTFLVGPNGSGKSNFLDALRFVADGLNRSLDHALRDRGGINDVRRRSGGHPTHFGLRLDFSLPRGSGHYAFRVGARAPGGYEVQSEECVVRRNEPLFEPDSFTVRAGAAQSTVANAPPALPDRLYLVNAAGLPQFRPVFDAFSQMGFYNLNPDVIRDLQSPDPGRLLARDGSNLASVLKQLAGHNGALKARVEEYLSKVTPSVHGVSVKPLGNKETLEFRQDVTGSAHPWHFPAASMSDGTLRALGVLVALFQSHNGTGPPVTLVGLEEPEVALHPAAAGVLLDALREASAQTQVIVTSHSPDLLDDPNLSTESILAVAVGRKGTVIGAIDEAGRSALLDRLYTPGELLRLGQLEPEAKARDAADRNQLRLFDSREL